MKFLLILFFSAALLSFFLPVVLSLNKPYPSVSTDYSSAAAPTPPVSASPDPSPAAVTSPESTDSSVTVRLQTDSGITELPMNEYLCGVVAAEMPADFAADALCAQAVAARTTTLHHMTGTPHPAHPEADICSNASCCEAWLPEDALRERWGEHYAEYAQKVRDAVTVTDGTVVIYESAPALCVYHSSSAGITESSEDVWGGALPYLVSVESPESADAVPEYITTVTVAQTEFRDTILSSFPDADLSGLPENWISDITVTDGGRVAEMTVGGVHIAGTTLRSLFSLRSAAFTLEFTHEEAVFTVTGYGHGVGMSQYGANILAQEGKSWRDILQWYYPGTDLGTVNDLG